MRRRVQHPLHPAPFQGHQRRAPCRWSKATCNRFPSRHRTCSASRARRPARPPVNNGSWHHVGGDPIFEAVTGPPEVGAECSRRRRRRLHADVGSRNPYEQASVVAHMQARPDAPRYSQTRCAHAQTKSTSALGAIRISAPMDGVAASQVRAPTVDHSRKVSRHPTRRQHHEAAVRDCERMWDRGST